MPFRKGARDRPTATTPAACAASCACGRDDRCSVDGETSYLFLSEDERESKRHACVRAASCTQSAMTSAASRASEYLAAAILRVGRSVRMQRELGTDTDHDHDDRPISFD
jgi:hypothetical protein